MAGNQRDWYSISVDSVRLFFGVGLVAVVGSGSFFAYQRWNQQEVERQAFEVVAKGQGLAKQLKTEEQLSSFKEEYQRSIQGLGEAEAALEQSEFWQAKSLGEESLLTLQGILDRIRHRGHAGIAWFVTVEGQVHYRRGEGGPFVEARDRDELYEGDYVRSSGNGSAEIYFTYENARFTVGPGALFKLTRSSGAGGSSQSVGFMEYGWVALNTSQSTSGITTRYSEVTVDQNSNATISLPRDSSQSRITVNRGAAEVRSARSGQVRELGPRQQLTQSGDRLGKTASLPDTPLLLEPPDNIQFNIDVTSEVKLAWEPVSGVERYALQISRNRLFFDNVIDVDGRSGTSASLGLQQEGNYRWRVAGFDAAGRRGPWSRARKFRVASFRGLSLEKDTIAPELAVEVISNGNIVILRGRTEPGARLEMNDEEIDVAADGSFSTSKVLFGRDEEWVQLLFKARDEAGNTTTERHRVFLTSL